VVQRGVRRTVLINLNKKVFTFTNYPPPPGHIILLPHQHSSSKSIALDAVGILRLLQYVPGGYWRLILEHPKETGCEGIQWLQMAQHKASWELLSNTAPYKSKF
jgi:hypothetical protein